MINKNQTVKKIKLIHEQLADEYGIKMEDLYNGTGLKPIPKEWIWEIIILATETIKDPVPFEIIKNKKERMLLLGFDKEEVIDKFIALFRENFFTQIDKYIENIGENPIVYNRSAIMTIEKQKKQLVIQLS